ncbi:MAG: ATP-binding cassette domain-containing protein [Holdemanella sp.]|uniref:ATP-binding cassette domain-containing protein n=1 Tax=Holdemanella sp. TaxID=1971762 RepID=UPI003991D96C
MSKAGVSIDRIQYIMDSPEEHDKPNACTPPLNRDIRFEHVSFGYEGEKKVLEDVNAVIPAGSTFAILGSTGSGKSTLMHLLNRLYDLPPENGRITIGGVDIADMKADWVRENVGMVLQEPFLFSRTIGENIGIASRELTMTEMREAGSYCLHRRNHRQPDQGLRHHRRRTGRDPVRRSEAAARPSPAP